ncbi:hypothetical protein [Nitratireductor sp. ZSWI3]|uniref:hypothetical protein n=1 Tax=Nitratireductor sp. ZSWI3 TaxID=2966359 RepID=UPI00214FF79D|nr:hypothetical protein [Nitratireductor sp. ZSWI3]MCR4269145.1 hypothetical protein [Nitratireductor sp. ZSWI3]
MAWDHDENHCPLAAVDRRLSDVHRFWHQAERAYFNPDEFRVSIQAAIQTARQVSFVLQKHKTAIPDFDKWYGGWQEKLAAIPLMKWMVEARNRIEKQGDLEAHSFISAEIVASHLDEGPKIQVPAKLSDAPLELVKSIPDSMVGNHIKKDGVLRIRRRWIENTLPDFELLDAVATAYGQLAQLVHSAHMQMGLLGPVTTNVDTGEQYPEGLRDGRLPCMIGHEDARTLDVWLANGQPLEFEEIRKEVNLTEAPELKDRYGVDPAKMYAENGKAQDHARSLFAAARMMFEKDGHHITIAILLRDGRPVGMRELRPMEHGHKFIMMRALAREAQKIAADAVVLISESWSAPANPDKPYMRAVDSPDRKEFLTATAVSRDGEPILLRAEILRDGKKVKLDETREEFDGAHFIFAPLYEVWKKPIPVQWGDMPTGIDRAEQK